jgi:REP-associated tyrosine transposase
VLVGGVDERVKVSIGDVAAEVGAEVIEVEVMPDQVHLLAEVPPTVPLSRFVGLAKGRSSRLFRMEFPPLAPCPSGES